MDPIEPVELGGSLTKLEPLQMAHADGLLRAADADEVFAWLRFPRLLSLDDAQEWIEQALRDRDSHRRLPFAVISVDRSAVIGSTSYWDFDVHDAHIEIGSTWLSREAWRTGHNTEAKLLLMTHAFEVLCVERITFQTDSQNARSQTAIERLGAIKEGVHRHEMRRRDGSWRDSVYFSLLRSEWPSAKARLMYRLEASR
jgi:RimJ/RimL family protein N-acetyltransferase